MKIDIEEYSSEVEKYWFGIKKNYSKKIVGAILNNSIVSLTPMKKEPIIDIIDSYTESGKQLKDQYKIYMYYEDITIKKYPNFDTYMRWMWLAYWQPYCIVRFYKETCENDFCKPSTEDATNENQIFNTVPSYSESTNEKSLWCFEFRWCGDVSSGWKEYIKILMNFWETGIMRYEEVRPDIKTLKIVRIRRGTELYTKKLNKQTNALYTIMNRYETSNENEDLQQKIDNYEKKYNTSTMFRLARKRKNDYLKEITSQKQLYERKYVAQIIENPVIYSKIESLVKLLPGPTKMNSEVIEVPINTEFHTIRKSNSTKKGEELKPRGRKLLFFCEDIRLCAQATYSSKYTKRPVWTISNTEPLKILNIKEERFKFFDFVKDRDLREDLLDSSFVLREAIIYAYIKQHGLDGWKAMVMFDQPRGNVEYYEFAFLEDNLQKFELISNKPLKLKF